jgi:phosphoribosylformylglycinamidine synthase
VAGAPPAIDLAAEKRLIECLVNLASERAVSSAHDVSDGGIAVTLAECCFTSEGLAAEVSLTTKGAPEPTNKEALMREDELAAEVALFGEGGARAVVSSSPELLARVSQIAAQYGVRLERVGTVTRGEFRIQYNGGNFIQGSVDSFQKAWSGSLAAALKSA